MGPPVPDEYLYHVVDALDEVAKETGKSIPQIALNWLFQRPTVSSVIIGARNEKQLRENLGAIGWNLTPEQMTRLDARAKRRRPIPIGTKPVFPSAIRLRFDLTSGCRSACCSNAPSCHSAVTCLACLSAAARGNATINEVIER